MGTTHLNYVQFDVAQIIEHPLECGALFVSNGPHIDNIGHILGNTLASTHFGRCLTSPPGKWAPIRQVEPTCLFAQLIKTKPGYKLKFIRTVICCGQLRNIASSQILWTPWNRFRWATQPHLSSCRHDSTCILLTNGLLFPELLPNLPFILCHTNYPTFYDGHTRRLYSYFDIACFCPTNLGFYPNRLGSYSVCLNHHDL